MPSEHELPRSAAPLYVIFCPILQRICGQLVTVSTHGRILWLDAETLKRAHTLLSVVPLANIMFLTLFVQMDEQTYINRHQ